MSDDPAARRPRLDVVMPAHNEAATIEEVVRELHDALTRWVEPRLIVCEDGSTDGTPALLARLAHELPLDVITTPGRKGYAQAMLDGLRQARAPWVLAIDSDGQLDPVDFAAFWELRDRADVVIGSRVRRADTIARRVISRMFRVLYDALFHFPVDDPSCPFVLMTAASAKALVDRLGTMEVGFWWEFVAQAHHAGLAIRQVPVRHRSRAGGASRAIPLRRVPAIAVTHTIALLRLWRRLQSGQP